MDEIIEGQKAKLKEILLTYLKVNREDVELVYEIEVPDEIDSMSNRDFKSWVLSIQHIVYEETGKIGAETALFRYMNKYLMSHGEDIIHNMEELRNWVIEENPYNS
ncbi:MAG: hypothetical protein IJ371_04880 [Clostridia bacterium]|nr:hypothetical protein [Clostridia bacterium]